MWSRVLDSGSGPIRPVVWRSTAGVPEPIAAQASANPALEDLRQMRARIAEMSAATEQQAKAAHITGFQAGQEASRQAAQAEVRATLETLASTIAQISSLRTETIHNAEADTVRLAIEIARRILHRELSIDRSALEGLMKAAIEKLQTQEIYRVRVHPDQAAIVQSCLEKMGRAERVEVASDPILPRGAAMFEISRGALDASVETQLAEIERGLVDHLEERA